MDQGNDFYRQNWNLPQKQPKKNKRWIIWVVVGVAFLFLMGEGIYKISLLGKNIGKQLGNLNDQRLKKADSTSNISNDGEYSILYSKLGTDSISIAIRAQTEKLKVETDSMCGLLDKYYNGFRDTIGETKSMFFDPNFSVQYFIKTGRATFLKKKLLSYRANEFKALPIGQQDSSLLYSLRIVDHPKIGNRLLQNMMSWETLMFQQPSSNAQLALKMLKGNVRAFEKQILLKWEETIVPGNKGDSVKSVH